MVIIKLIGGLGNQLSQYAFGKYIATKNNTELIIDKSSFETYKLHNYSLHHFNINENFALRRNIPWYELRLHNRYLDFILNKIKPWLRNKSHIVEKGLFKKELLDLRGDYLYLEGYWQSEKYFCEIESILRKDLEFKTPPSEKNQLLINEILSQDNSVSLHIRRGDYVSNQTSNKIHGTCNIDYYLRAVQYLIDRYPQSKFYIFSDDIPWVKENLVLPYPSCYIDHNDAISNYEDMRLMSLCKHNIIANSTFSWWGAWLNKNSEKTVIAPAQWFNDTKHLDESNDVVPEKWIKL